MEPTRGGSGTRAAIDRSKVGFRKAEKAGWVSVAGHILPTQWKELDADLERLPATPLDRTSTIVQLLLDVDGRSRVIVQRLTALPADGAPE